VRARIVASGPGLNSINARLAGRSNDLKLGHGQQCGRLVRRRHVLEICLRAICVNEVLHLGEHSLKHQRAVAAGPRFAGSDAMHPGYGPAPALGC
jgi:hypothetical protein